MKLLDDYKEYIQLSRRLVGLSALRKNIGQSANCAYMPFATTMCKINIIPFSFKSSTLIPLGMRMLYLLLHVIKKKKINFTF